MEEDQETKKEKRMRLNKVGKRTQSMESSVTYLGPDDEVASQYRLSKIPLKCDQGESWATMYLGLSSR